MRKIILNWLFGWYAIPKYCSAIDFYKNIKWDSEESGVMNRVRENRSIKSILGFVIVLVKYEDEVVIWRIFDNNQQNKNIYIVPSYEVLIKTLHDILNLGIITKGSGAELRMLNNQPVDFFRESGNIDAHKYILA